MEPVWSPFPFVAETVRVKHPDFPEGVLINKADFESEKYEFFAAPESPAAD
jgi:hypothetical protein